MKRSQQNKLDNANKYLEWAEEKIVERKNQLDNLFKKKALILLN